MPSTNQAVTHGRAHKVGKTGKTSVNRLLAVASLLFSAFIVAWVLWYCRYGFDFTDEGYYLNWMSQPFTYVASATQFGFLYHPLYLLLGGDVALLRQVNVVCTYLLSVYAAWLLLRVGRHAKGDVLLWLAVAASFAIAALTFPAFAGVWLFPTPSYNWAAFQGLLVTLIGMLLAERAHHCRSTIGWVLIGIGGWLTFMGKPTSAALLALLVTVYVALSGKLSLRQISISIATAVGLLLAAAFVIDGGASAFIDRNVVGIEFGRTLGYSLEVLRLEPLVLPEVTLLGAGYLFALTCISVCVANWQPYFLPPLGMFCAAMLSATGVFLFKDIVSLQAIPAEQRGLMLVPVAIALLLAGLILFRREVLRKMRFSTVAVASALTVFPYAYALGTSNSYWVQMPSAAIFILFAGLAIAGPWFTSAPAGRGLFGAGFVVQFFSLLLIVSALANPYRNPQPLPRNEVDVSIQERGNLRLAGSHAKYLADLKELAGQSEFRAGTPMIDMTGHSPGVLYFLGARSVGLAWTLGGQPGSAAFVANALRYVPCEQLAQSWLLMEPQGPWQIPEQVLSTFGAEATANYAPVGTVQGPHGVPQQLLKPSRSEVEAKAACVLARRDTN